MPSNKVYKMDGQIVNGYKVKNEARSLTVEPIQSRPRSELKIFAHWICLPIDGRNIEIGKLCSFIDIRFSVIAFVNVYVFGQFPKMLKYIVNAT